jgi:SAM-dependent methyltransferase
VLAHRSRIPAATAIDSSPNVASNHWRDVSLQWNLIGPPLRPSFEDIAFYTAQIHRWARRHGQVSALILGVTPELCQLAWPEGSTVSAVDHTPQMIENVWPGPQSAARCAEWTNLPLSTASCNVVLCDCGIVLLPYPQGHCKLVQELARVVTPDGICIFRLLVPPKMRERTEIVLRDLLSGMIANPNILKLRLGMSLQDDIGGGVQLARIWEALHEAAPDLNRVADRIGWPRAPLLAINAYRDCPTRYHFLDVAEVRQLFCEHPGGFAFETAHRPSYALGERCPTLVFRRLR